MALPQPQFWSWRGHRIAWTRQGPGDAPCAVVLIHGFGASLGHWRHTLPALAGSAEVYALDLLGFGGSDKPRSQLEGEPEAPGAVRYCFDLWAEQVQSFVHELVRADRQIRPLHLVGNSIGGIVALNTARLLQQQAEPASQVVLIDCAQRSLDEKRIAELPIWEQAGRPLLKQLVRQRWLLVPLFAGLARPSFIRRVLRVAYPSGANVDDELVALLHRPATDPGAVESFRGFVNLFRDHLAPDLLAQLNLPVRMLWGDLDPWEAPAVARRWADTQACVRELQVLEGLGHCPHDEAPERVNPILLAWLSADDTPA
ncbi:MAG: alpha/beta fold hydrolase [Synechococcaceae cyanobacterium]|nr:alpha/beta fold hydrolase [Synechococcaceae cyanobacterium]